MDIKNRVCFECGEIGNFKRIEKTVEVEIKNLKFKNNHTYYECQHCGEWYEPFEDIDKNLLSDYELYAKLTN